MSGTPITPEELNVILEDFGGASTALHLQNADDLLATIQAGHAAQAREEALKIRVAKLEAQQRTVSDVREVMAYRLEKVWEIGPEVIGDLLSWEWHTPSPLAEVVAHQDGVIRALAEALDKSRIALDDWTNTFAPEFCDPERVKEARARIHRDGLLAYLADIQQQNREALNASKTPYPFCPATTPSTETPR